MHLDRALAILIFAATAAIWLHMVAPHSVVKPVVELGAPVGFVLRDGTTVWYTKRTSI